MRNIGVGVKDSDRLIAYLEHMLKEVTGDPTVVVRKIPEAEQYEDGPKLKVNFDGKTNLNAIGKPPQHLAMILKKIFPKAFMPLEVHAVDFTAQDNSTQIDATGRYDLFLYVPSFYVAVDAAKRNDESRFTASQENLKKRIH